MLNATTSRAAFAGLALFAASVSFASQAIAKDRPDPPKLVLQITIDQLRGDLPFRYYDRLGEGGLRFLLDEGVVFRDAHHAHANTETIVGHTTLATGTYPSVHGMVGNLWFDRETGQTIYNIEDARYKLLTAGADVDDSSEIDPTQRAARSEGRSPAAILVTTFGDELRSATGGRSKVFAVSVKDRGAVSMAGHGGKAFWFSKASGEFVTSSYYYDRYPAWVDAFNAKRPTERFSGKSWSLLNDRDSYMFGGADDHAWETDVGGFGRVFPHAYGASDGKYFTTLLTLSPAGDELLLDFARTVLVEEQLGKDEVTDLLERQFFLDRLCRSYIWPFEPRGGGQHSCISIAQSLRCWHSLTSRSVSTIH